MEKIKIGSSQLSASQLGLGCMRMADESKEKAVEVINTALNKELHSLITQIFMEKVNRKYCSPKHLKIQMLDEKTLYCNLK